MDSYNKHLNFKELYDNALKKTPFPCSKHSPELEMKILDLTGTIKSRLKWCTYRKLEVVKVPKHVKTSKDTGSHIEVSISQFHIVKLRK